MSESKTERAIGEQWIKEPALYYADDNGSVRKAAIFTKTETGTSISMGFPVCQISEWVGGATARAIAAALSAYDPEAAELSKAEAR